MLFYNIWNVMKLFTNATYLKIINNLNTTLEGTGHTDIWELS